MLLATLHIKLFLRSFCLFLVAGSTCCLSPYCSSPLSSLVKASLLLSALTDLSQFALVATETLLTSPPSHPVTSRKRVLNLNFQSKLICRASPSVSAQEVEVLHQNISSQGQRGLAILAGSTVRLCVRIRPQQVPEGTRYSVFEISTRTLLEKFYYSAE